MKTVLLVKATAMMITTLVSIKVENAAVTVGKALSGSECAGSRFQQYGKQFAAEAFS